MTSYGGSIWGKAEGIWWRSDEGMFFRPEQVAGFMYMSWKEGHAWKVIAHEDRLEFPGSFTLYLRPEKPVLPNDGL